MQNRTGEFTQTQDTEADSGSQRTLLTLAVRDYGDGNDSFTEGIDEQLEVVAEWWSGQGAGADSSFRQIPPPDLEKREDVEDFLRDHEVREMEGQALVMFITGHGVSSARTHFLKLPGSVKGRHLNTSVRTTELITAALDSHVRNVLVIVNTCYAGKIRSELDDVLEDIRAERRTQCSLDVLVTCGHDRPVQVRRFPTLLRGALQRLRTTAGITTPYLTVAELMAEFERGLGTEEAIRKHRLHRVVDGSGILTPTPCIPNPGYRYGHDPVGGGLRQAGTPAADYWLDRATGRTQDSDPGWYFRGRDDINRSVTEFLSPARARGVLLITGTAGSGKSAVLARAVVLSNPSFQDEPVFKTAVDLAAEGTVPAPGSITGAILARHRGPADLARDILRALGVEPGRPASTEDAVVTCTQQIIETLRGRSEPVTLVIDGLDEAAELPRVIDDVLAPLSEFCSPQLGQVPAPRQDGDPPPPFMPAGLRLLIGVRSSLPLSHSPVELPDAEQGLSEALQAAFPTAEEQRTDGKGSVKDIEQYLHALICEGGHRDTAEEAAAMVAPEVWPSFISARLAGEQLRSTEDPAAVARQAEWLAMLQGGMTGLLRRDLVLVAGDGLPSDVALALLRASAFAAGAGIPWSNIWPRMGRVFLGRQLPDWDDMIGKLLKSRLNGYLAHDHEDDRRVYRPAHEAVAEVLCDLDADLLDAAEDGPDTAGDPPAHLAPGTPGADPLGAAEEPGTPGAPGADPLDAAEDPLAPGAAE
ncbi:ATP-binding protein [Streptomyces sp. NPDC002809]|uniref:ATP-binding protein n=1 Tax=Streptomyces sp. NPDC002809 TaxID=3154433 RepID=UPI00331CFA4A